MLSNSELAHPAFAKMRERISFVHKAYPAECISPNLLSIEGIEEFPGFGGTGFFARREDEVFYVTARHCLSKQQNFDIARLAAGLHIPYSLTDSTPTTTDYVQFGEAITLKHDSDDIPGNFVDVVVLTINRPAMPSLYEKLIARAVKLPPSGQWLENFVQHPIAKDDYENGKGIRFTVMGYPKAGTASKIEYPDGQPVEIVTQAAKFSGHLGRGTGPDRYTLNDVSWQEDLNGFSGSPVIVGFRNGDGDNYALAGMLVSGGGQKAQFIKISLITEAMKPPCF
ncbi:MAG: hypothetical protein ACYCY1_11990 [Sulfuriferula sp.]